MPRKRGNPNWCRPAPMGTLTVSAPTFESVAGALGSAKEFEGFNSALKEWVNRNKHH